MSRLALSSHIGVGDSQVGQSSRSDNAAQFGEHGQVLYLLGRSAMDRRAGRCQRRRRRTILFAIPSEDQIEGSSFNAADTRVVLTPGWDRNDLWMAEGFGRPSTSWHRWFRPWESSSVERGASTTTVTVQTNGPA